MSGGEPIVPGDWSELLLPQPGVDVLGTHIRDWASEGACKDPEDAAELIQVMLAHAVLFLGDYQLLHHIWNLHPQFHTTVAPEEIPHCGSERNVAEELAALGVVLDRRNQGDLDSLQDSLRSEVGIPFCRPQVVFGLHPA